MKESFGAVIVAAGSSTRMGTGRSKVLELLNGKPVIRYSLEVLAGCRFIQEICIVCRGEDMPRIKQAAEGIDKPVIFAMGAKQRQDSVLNGVKALSEDWGYVLIHDGARPLVSMETVEAVCGDALKHGAATAAVMAKDTCKLSDREGFVESTPPRDRLMTVQTPQAFLREMYLYAVRRAADMGMSYTDDCQLIESAGGKVKLTQGEYKNIKLTTPEDMQAARTFLERGEKRTMRIGYGYDVHKLVTGRRLILGGVEIPYEKGLLGHSDADVLAHAVSDALLGAAALGDIGKHFPDTDPEYSGADSLKLLSCVCGLLKEKGYSIGNIDATLVAQRPKVSPYIGRMRENLAAACNMDVDRISVKATTEEGLGFTGSGQGMAASAVCLIEKTGE